MSAAPHSWQRVHLQQVTPQPWRNGGGLTHELVSRPAGEWRWRVSVARIERDGPFSHFSGVQRHFAVLRGAGVELDIDGMRHTLHAGGEPLAFEGGQACHGRLLAGATLDFNLMSRAAPAQLQRCRGQARPAWHSGHIAGLYACAPARLEGGGQDWTLQADELLWTEHLAAGDWLVQGEDVLAFSLKVEPP